MERTSNVISMVEGPPPYLMFSCRLCGNFSPTVVKIFTPEGYISDLGNKINLHIPIKLQLGDGLPDQCCWNCTTTLMSWHNFYVTCIATDQKLMIYKKNTAPTPKLAEPALHFEHVAVKNEREDIEETPTQPAQEVTQTMGQKYNLEQPEIHLKPNVEEDDVVEESIQQIKEEPESSETTESEESSVPDDEEDEDFVLPSEEEYEDDLLETWDDSDNEPLKKKELEQDRVPCHICKAVYTKDRIKLHLLRDHPNDTPFSCEICGKSFKSRYKINLHLAVHDRKHFECKVCKNIFKTRTQLEIHKVVHSGKKLFPCNLCGKELVRKASLLVHIRQKHEMTEQQYNDFLSDAAKLKRSKEAASKRDSKGAKVPTCNICNKTFTARQSLYKHRRTIHEKNNRISCDICGVFYSKIHRKEHLATHSDNRPFSCEICGRCFKSQNSLKKHNLHIHSGNIS